MKIIQVKLRRYGQIQSFLAIPDLKVGDPVIVEADRGLDYGQVISEPEEVSEPKKQIRRIMRRANENDLRQIKDNRYKARRFFEICEEKINRHRLKMKLVASEYSFDRSKIIFYFTAESRVDFRGLIKDLAKTLKARIELRQIGVRDEAKFYGGYGPCGRELCCAKFLKDFEPVTIKMAKDQNLPLNPSKISGVCGRLMCCLMYEHAIYKRLSQGLPREGEKINTPQGRGKVINVNILKRTATVEIEDGRQIELKY